MNDFKRKNFLKSFLSLLGATDIRWRNSDENKIFGTVIYPEVEQFEKTESGFEEQKFCWNMSEENVPSENVAKIVNVLKAHNFIDIDKITATPEEIFLKMENLDFSSFKTALDELLKVEVKMIDDGEETDSFFVHF